MKCPECQSDHINKNGHRGQKQNYMALLFLVGEIVSIIKSGK
jgi:hypothetical protein